VNRNQQGQALITGYVNAYEAAFGFKPTVNRHTAKWGFLDVLDSVGYERACELIKYYMTCNANHSPQNFFQTFDRLEEVMVASRDDEARRAKLREQTRLRVEEFEQRSSSNQRNL